MVKNKKHASVKKRILKFVEEMEWLFDYQNFDRSIIFKTEEKEIDGALAAAEIIHQHEYRRVTIKIYPAFFDSTPKEQREYLLHELSHTFTDKLYHASDDLINGRHHSTEHLRKLNEEATSRITNILGALLEGKKNYAKRGYANYLQPKR